MPRRPKETDAQRKARLSAERKERKLQKEAITPREQVYIAERLKPGVGRGEAAQRAGLKSVPRRPQVERTVRKLVRKQLDIANISAIDVLNEVKRVAMVDVGNFYDDNNTMLPIRDIDEDSRRAITGVEVKELFDWEENDEGERERVLVGYTVKARTEKVKGLEMLMKHFGLMNGEGKKGGDRLAEVVAAFDQGPVDSEAQNGNN